MLKVTLFLLVASVIALTIAETERDKYARIHRECQEDPNSKLDEDIWKRKKAGESVKDPHSGAHSLCMSKKMGSQDDNGKLNKAVIKRGLERLIKDEATLQKAINECVVDKDTPEETAENLGACIRKYAQSQYHADH